MAAEGTFPTTDEPDDGGQTILLDGHVDIVDESLRVVMSSCRIVLLAHSKDPLEIRMGSVLTGWTSEETGTTSGAIKKLQVRPHEVAAKAQALKGRLSGLFSRGSKLTYLRGWGERSKVRPT